MSESSESRASTVRAALHRMVDDLEHLDALIFTTFGLSVPFFEDNVLGPLANEKFKLSTLNEIHAASNFCDKHNLAVFYDGHATTAIDKRATFDTFPVFLPSGAFHPKVVVVFGRAHQQPVVRLLVASANLTLSGWAKNREVVAVTDVDRPAVAGPLSQLLQWLFETQGSREAELRERYDGLLAHLDAISQISSDSSESSSRRLLVSIPSRTNSLMSILAATGAASMLVASPYFGPRAHAYFRQNLFRESPGDIDLRLVPAVDEHDRLALLQSDVETFWDDDRAQLGRLDTLDADADRFDHFKLIAWEDTAVVGSHNATEAALGSADGTGHKNVEVSLAMPCNYSSLGYQSYDEMPAGQPSEDELFDDQPRRQLPCRVEVTADWRERVYTVEADRTLAGYEVRLPGIERRVPIEEHAEVPFSWQTDVELLERRWFEVFRLQADGPRRIYRGYINEVHWRGFRREAVMESLTACLDAWVEGTAIDDAFKPDFMRPLSEQLRVDREERLEPAKLDTGSDDVFENYFRLFRATRSFWERFENTLTRQSGEPDVEGAARLLHSAPGSLQRVIELIEERTGKEDDPWSVYRFVLVHEVARLIKQAREALQERRATELQDTLDELDARASALCETFEAHPAWAGVMQQGDTDVLNYVLEELGYADAVQ